MGDRLDRLFSCAKEGLWLSRGDINYARDFLFRDDALTNNDTYRALYVVFLSERPSSEGEKLLNQFLGDDADDYIRFGALKGLIRYWELGDKYKEYIYRTISEKFGNENYIESISFLLSYILTRISEPCWGEFIDLIVGIIDSVINIGIDKLEFDQEVAFLNLCGHILDVYEEEDMYTRGDLDLDGAFKISGKLKTYLLHLRTS